MGKDTKPNTAAPSSLGQLWADLKTLQQTVKELKAVVDRLKDVLFTQDNWHSKIIKWIGKEVFFSVDPHELLDGKGTVGKLLWADRYHIGVEILCLDGNGNRNVPKEHLVNKGHIVHIREV